VIITGIDCKNCTYYKKLQELEEENKMLKRYKFLFEKARELKEKTDKWAQKCLAENEDLKDSLKKTVCQAECFKHKEAIKYKSALEEIREDLTNWLRSDWSCFQCRSRMDGKIQGIILKIKEVISDNN